MVMSPSPGAGNIFNAGTEALVNPVNTVGVMGAGLALQFKKQYPENYEAYRKVCLVGALSKLPRWILNVPTKTHYNKPSTLDYIRRSAEALAAELVNRKILSVAIPPLGCGLGGLSWGDVKPILVDALTPLVTTCVLYDPA